VNGLSITLPPELLDELVVRVAERVLEQLAVEAAPVESPYLTVAEAAAFLRSKPQRVYDLRSSRRLTRHKDGSRVLVKRAELEAHLAGETPRTRTGRVAPALPHPSQTRTAKRFPSTRA